MINRLQPLSRNQRIVVGLSGLAFLAVGIAVVIGITQAVHGYWRTRENVTAEARLQSVELRVVSGGRSGSSSSTVARYAYSVADRTFTGSRVSLFENSADFYPVLLGSYRAGTPIRVFIDPTQPEFSVFHRDFSGGALLANSPFWFIFPLIGCFLMWVVVRAPQKQRRQ